MDSSLSDQDPADKTPFEEQLLSSHPYGPAMEEVVTTVFSSLPPLGP
jgi:hypothetical protein